MNALRYILSGVHNKTENPILQNLCSLLVLLMVETIGGIALCFKTRYVTPGHQYQAWARSGSVIFTQREIWLFCKSVGIDYFGFLSLADKDTGRKNALSSRYERRAPTSHQQVALKAEGNIQSVSCWKPLVKHRQPLEITFWFDPILELEFPSIILQISH